MADVTGALHVDHRGKTHTLRLTFLVLAELQGAHGDDFIKRMEARDGKLPDFGLMVDVVARALVRGGDVAPEVATLLADDMLAADQGILARLMQAAFPEAKVDAAPGNVEPAALAKAG